MGEAADTDGQQGRSADEVVNCDEKDQNDANVVLVLFVLSVPSKPHIGLINTFLNSTSVL